MSIYSIFRGKNIEFIHHMIPPSWPFSLTVLNLIWLVFYNLFLLGYGLNLLVLKSLLRGESGRNGQINQGLNIGYDDHMGSYFG